MVSKALIRQMIELSNREMQDRFVLLGNGSRTYTESQKEYALSLIDIYGVRATSRMLQVPRRTIQRWCQQYQKSVDRCPPWVKDWAERRRERREFWQRRGYS